MVNDCGWYWSDDHEKLKTWGIQGRKEQSASSQMFKLVLEKAEEPEIKLPTSAGSWKKHASSRKTSISALLTMPKPLCGSQQTGKF